MVLFVNHLFENDAKVDGIQTTSQMKMRKDSFENDVKVDGIQTNGRRI